MNKQWVVVGLAVMILAGATGTAAAQAISAPNAAPKPAANSRAGLALKLTTLGIGIEGAVPVSERFNVRAGFNVFNLNHDFDNDGIALAAKLNMRSFSTYLDWFPFDGGFHVSPGLMLYNGNELSAVASVPGGKQFDLGSERLVSNPANPVTGTATIAFERVAPSLVLGWGNLVPRSERHWSIPFEIGVVYSRQPRATLALGGSACTPNLGNCRLIAADSGLQADLAKEQSNLNSDLAPLKVLPIISLGFSYKF